MKMNPEQSIIALLSVCLVIAIWVFIWSSIERRKLVLSNAEKSETINLLRDELLDTMMKNQENIMNLSDARGVIRDSSLQIEEQKQTIKNRDNSINSHKANYSRLKNDFEAYKKTLKEDFCTVPIHLSPVFAIPPTPKDSIALERIGKDLFFWQVLDKKWTKVNLQPFGQ